MPQIMDVMVQFPSDWALWGFIPDWIEPAMTSDTPLWEQIHNNYAHGGGWHDFEGFEVKLDDETNTYNIQYPGDPPYHEIDRLQVDDQMLVLFPHSWVMWMRGDETKIARID